MKVITNTNVILENGILYDGIVLIENGKIIDVNKRNGYAIPTNAEVLDGKGLYLAPGLIDIHNHGSQESFFTQDPEGCCNHFLKHGQTSVLPTFYQTLTAKEMIDGAKKLKEFSKKGVGRIIKGLYMEGPYMMAMGSNQELFKWNGDIELCKYKELVDKLASFVKIWAIDPARKNIEEFMRYVKSVNKKAIFAFGHSCATAEDCEKVAPLGVKVQTHHGDSGTAPKINQVRNGAGCDDFTLATDDIYAEIICDETGVHLAPYTIRAVIKAKGTKKIILITDSYPKTGDYKNDITKGVLYGTDLNYDSNGLLAGSHLTLDNACRNMIKHTGVKLYEAIRFATLNPAKLIGISKNYGSIKKGKVADLILIDKDINVKSVFLQGELVVEN
ncbi:MAG: amidohydrolase family protein [Clostridia bacterium]|nr:amidohydrolase family protein [Clostridia bacterium]